LSDGPPIGIGRRGPMAAQGLFNSSRIQARRLVRSASAHAVIGQPSHIPHPRGQISRPARAASPIGLADDWRRISFPGFAIFLFSNSFFSLHIQTQKPCRAQIQSIADRPCDGPDGSPGRVSIATVLSDKASAQVRDQMGIDDDYGEFLAQWRGQGYRTIALSPFGGPGP